jgi:hypothetical protein
VKQRVGGIERRNLFKEEFIDRGGNQSLLLGIGPIALGIRMWPPALEAIFSPASGKQAKMGAVMIYEGNKLL